MAISLTAAQRAVLAHVVLNPDDWLAKAVAGLGEERATDALAAKVARWQPVRDADVTTRRAAYKTRAQREIT